MNQKIIRLEEYRHGGPKAVKVYPTDAVARSAVLRHNDDQVVSYTKKAKPSRAFTQTMQKCLANILRSESLVDSATRQREDGNLAEAVKEAVRADSYADSAMGVSCRLNPSRFGERIAAAEARAVASSQKLRASKMKNELIEALGQENAEQIINTMTWELKEGV